MGFRETRRYIDAEKASGRQGLKLDNVEKKKERNL
jgi:hypothetical protein